MFETHPVNEHRLNDLCQQLKEIKNDHVHCNNIENHISEKDRVKIDDMRKRFDSLLYKN